LANRKIKNGVLVFIEIEHNEIAEVSLELVCKARELADDLKVDVISLLIGAEGNSDFEQSLINYGSDIVYTFNDYRLDHYETLPYTKIVSTVINRAAPQIVLFGATPVGRDLAPRVASTLKTGLTADCTALQIGDHENRKEKKVYKDILYQIRPAFGGNIIATIVAPEHRPQMATVRDGVMKLDNVLKKRSGQVIPQTVTLSASNFVCEFINRTIIPKSINLKNADIIVAGGAGVESKAKFKLIHSLAHTLGGKVGASRAAIDSGYISHDHQIGQTGTTVRPKLYIACGISGAIQHQAGMEHSNKIIAINSDPNAPIFNIAHYGIIGDLHKVIPMMIKAYKTKS
jgi:electron transfer flavoprotein alpha subunit